MTRRETFFSVGGMNENQYIGEDLEFCRKVNLKYGKNRIFYVGDLIVYHKDRSIKNFLKQRFVYGLYISESIKNTSFSGKLISLTPLIFFSIVVILFFMIYQNIFFYLFLFICFLLSFFLIYFELKKFKLKFIFFIKVYFTIIFANLSYVFGNIISFVKLRNIISRKIYSNSQS